jgi:hypothetical protein
MVYFLEIQVVFAILQPVAGIAGPVLRAGNAP